MEYGEIKDCMIQAEQFRLNIWIEGVWLMTGK